MTTDPALIEQTLLAFPDTHQPVAFRLRDLIRQTASALELPGGVVETLKWGQPSWLPARRGIGTTVRVAVHDPGTVGLFVHCQTTLIGEVRLHYGEALTYSDNRAVLFDVAKPLPEDAVVDVVERALTYHRNAPA